MAGKIRVRGDLKKLDQLVKNIEDLAKPELVLEMAKAAGDIAVALAIDGATKGISPRGQKWRPRKKDGSLANRWVPATLRLSLRGRVFEVRSSNDVALVHHAGATRRPTYLGGKFGFSIGFKLPKPKLPSIPSVPIPSVPSVSIGALGGGGGGGSGDKWKRYKWRLPTRRIVPGRRLPRRYAKPIIAALKEILATNVVKGVKTSSAKKGRRRDSTGRFLKT